MKTTPASFLSCVRALAFAAMLLPASLFAQVSVFSRSDAGTDLWWNDTPANFPWFYEGGSGNQNRPDNPGGSTANWMQIGHNNNTTMNVNGTFFRIGSLEIASTATSARTYNSSLGGGWSFRTSGSGFTNNSTGNQTVNVGVGIDASTVLFRANATSTNTFTSDIFLNGNTADFGGSSDTGRFVVSGTVSGTSAGIVQLRKTGANTLVLSGNNTYQGKTAIEGGAISIGANTNLGANPGSLTADQLTLSSGGKLLTTGTFTLSGNRGITFGTGGGTLEVSSGNTLTLGTSGQINGANTLTKLGAGTLSLGNASNSSTFSGKFIVGDGALSVTADNRFGAAFGSLTANAITLSNGGKLLANGTFSLNSTRGITFGVGGGVIEVAPNQTFTMATSGQLNSSATLTKLGSGTLNLSNANNSGTFTGKVIIGEGAISITADNRLGAAPGSPTADALTLTNGGKLLANGTFTLAGNRGVTFGTGGGALEVAAGQTFTIGTSSQFSGSGSLTKLGAGTLVSTAQQLTYSGKVIIGEGAISIDADSRLGANPVTYTPDAVTLTNGAKLVTSGNFSLGSNRGLTLGTGGGILEVASGNTLTLGAANLLNGSGTFTKEGAGTLAVTAANANTGATIISGGVLNLNATTGAAAAGTTSVTVNTGATLLLSKTDQVNNSATVTLSGGTIQRGAGVNETFSDLNVSSASTINFGGTSENRFLQFGAVTGGANLTIANFLLDNRFVFSTTSLSAGTTIANSFTFLTSDARAYSFDTGNNLFTITAIPEPSTVLAAIGLAGLMLWPAGRRYFRRKTKA